MNSSVKGDDMRPLLRSVSDQSWSEKIEYYA